MSTSLKSKFFICDKNTGLVKAKIECKKEDVLIKDSEVIIPSNGNKISDVYYDAQDECVKTKKRFEDGFFVGDEYRVQLPKGAIVMWQGTTYIVDGGLLEVLVDQPGKHTISFIHPHYYFENREIENTDSN